LSKVRVAYEYIMNNKNYHILGCIMTYVHTSTPTFWDCYNEAFQTSGPVHNTKEHLVVPKTTNYKYTTQFIVDSIKKAFSKHSKHADPIP